MTVYGQLMDVPGLLAGEDLSAWQFKPVKLASTAGEVVKGDAVADVILGILQNDPTDGQAAHIAGPGSISRVVAGTSVLTAAAFLTVNSTGVTPTTTDNTAVCGKAVEAASATNDLIMIQVLAQRY